MYYLLSEYSCIPSMKVNNIQVCQQKVHGHSQAYCSACMHYTIYIACSEEPCTSVGDCVSAVKEAHLERHCVV